MTSRPPNQPDGALKQQYTLPDVVPRKAAHGDIQALKMKKLKKQQTLLREKAPWKFCKQGQLDELKRWCQEDKNNKDRLKKGRYRGVFGENPLHVSILYENSEVAKWLITNFPKLLFQKYEEAEYHDDDDDELLLEYEGETALHVIIAKDNWDLFNFVLPPLMSQDDEFDLKGNELWQLREEKERKKLKQKQEKPKKEEKEENEEKDEKKEEEEQYENNETEQKEKKEDDKANDDDNGLYLDTVHLNADVKKNNDDGDISPVTPLKTPKSYYYPSGDKAEMEHTEKLKTLINDSMATGSFFDTMVDYGEFAITFCVALQRKKMFRRLLEYDADLDVEDGESKNTLFHYCAKHNLVDMFQYIMELCELKEKDKEKAQNALKERNEQHYTCFQFAVKHKNKKIFEEILQWKERTIWQYGSVKFVACPLSELDTHGDNKNSVLEVIVAENALEFVELPVIKAILTEKWQLYARTYFSVWCILHMIYCGTLFMLYSYDLVFKEGEYAVIGLTAMKFIVTEYQRLSELYDLIGEHGRKVGMAIFFQWNMDETSVIEFFHYLSLLCNLTIICIWIAIGIGEQEYITLFMTISIISESLYTIYFCLAAETLGTLVVSTLRIIMGDVRRFLVLFGVVAVAFGFAIVLISDENIKLHRAIVSLFYILVGAGDYWLPEDNEWELSSWRIWANEVIYFLFLMISSVLLFNLLIAIFSETLVNIAEQSSANWYYLRASIILSIERKVDDWCFKSWVYRRTGEKGADYGFDDVAGKQDDKKEAIEEPLHYMVFKHNLITDKLEEPQKKSGFLNKVTNRMKKRMSNAGSPKIKNVKNEDQQENEMQKLIINSTNQPTEDNAKNPATNETNDVVEERNDNNDVEETNVNDDDNKEETFEE